MNPRSASSFSRRSVMGDSVGHFKATSPPSVVKLGVGSPPPNPPPSTPRMAAHQPYSANAPVSFAPRAYAALPHRYFEWSVPSTPSSYWKASMVLLFLP